jgi:hypothetical protein
MRFPDHQIIEVSKDRPQGPGAAGVGLPLLAALLLWGPLWAASFINHGHPQLPWRLAGMLLAAGSAAAGWLPAENVRPWFLRWGTGALLGALLLQAARSGSAHAAQAYLGGWPWAFVAGQQLQAHGLWALGTVLGLILAPALWALAWEPSPPFLSRWGWRGLYVWVLFSLCFFGNLLALPGLPLGAAKAATTLGIAALLACIPAFFGVQRSRVQRLFQDDDPRWLRWAGRALVIYAVLNFATAMLSNILMHEIKLQAGAYVAMDRGVVLGPATEGQYRFQVQADARAIAAFAALFIQFILLDLARARQILPAWETGRRSKSPRLSLHAGDSFTPPAGGSAEWRPSPGLRGKNLLIGTIMAGFGGGLAWLCWAAVQGGIWIMLPFIAIGVWFVYIGGCAFFFALYQGSVAQISAEGLWLMETGFIRWGQVQKLQISDSTEPSVRIFVTPERSAEGVPWPFVPLRWFSGLRGNLASLPVQGGSIDGRAWARYAHQAHAVAVKPTSAVAKTGEDECA